MFFSSAFRVAVGARIRAQYLASLLAIDCDVACFEPSTRVGV
jgi:hypothetical protein